MAYYQAQDRKGHPFEYSQPIVGYQEPPKRRCALGGPAAVFVVCAVFGLAAHSLLISDPSPVLAVNEAILRNHSSAQGVHDPQRQQGLEDIEDTDSAGASPSTLPAPDAPAVHFMGCLQENCDAPMRNLAQASPAGSELLQCLGRSSNGVTATTCWGPHNPDEDNNNDAGQALRVCAICNVCIPGNVDPAQCGDDAARSWTGDGGNNSIAPTTLSSDHTETPLSRYEADEPRRRDVPVTNTSSSKRDTAKPWVPIMSGGRQTSTNVAGGDAVTTSAYETTNLAATSKKNKKHHHSSPHHSSKHHDGAAEAPAPFWAKYVSNEFSASQNAPWGRYMPVSDDHASKRDDFSFFDAAVLEASPTELHASSSSKKGYSVEGQPYLTDGQKYYPGGDFGGKASDKYPGSDFSGEYSGSDSHGRTSTTSKSASTSAGPHTGIPMWNGQIRTNPWEDRFSGQGAPPVSAFETTELSASGKKRDLPPASASAPAPAGSGTPMWNGQIRTNPWEDRFSGQGAPPVSAFETTELSSGSTSSGSTSSGSTSSDHDAPVTPWSKYDESSSPSDDDDDSWNKYPNGPPDGVQGGGGGVVPMLNFETTELDSSARSKSAHASKRHSSDKKSKTTKSTKGQPDHSAAPYRKAGPTTYQPPASSSSEPKRRSYGNPPARAGPQTSPSPDPPIFAPTPAGSMWSHYLGGSDSQGAGGAQVDQGGQSGSQQSGGGSQVDQGGQSGSQQSGQSGSGSQSQVDQGGQSGSQQSGADSASVATYAVDKGENVEEDLSLATTDFAASPASHSTSAHKRVHKDDSARKSFHSKRSKDEKDTLTRCYHVACNVLVGQVGASSPDTLACISKAGSKAAAANCLGHEDPKSPSNDLRTCMICHKCIDGHLKHPSVCENQASSWSNAGAAWSG